MSPVLHFSRHYVEMVVAMFAGMLVLGAPVALALGAVGVDLLDDAPGLYLFGMGVTMTVPMVAWMAFRGHGPRANAEMALSMMVPTVAAMALLGADLLGDVHDAMLVQHVVMFPAMLGVMLLRPSEYAGHAHERVAA
jgi:hypothetical protein